MTDDQQPSRPAFTQTGPGTVPATESAPAPEELLSETEPEDPDVGADGIGVGELP